MVATFRESRAIWLLAVLGIVAALYFAKDIFIPLAVAILLTFVLAPLVRALQHRGMPRTPAAILVAITAFAFILSVAGLLGEQVTELAGRLPATFEVVPDALTLLVPEFPARRSS